MPCARPSRSITKRPARNALELDHVLIAVADLEAAAGDLEARHGLVSVEGGRHPGWGTANRIVPLGETYVELIAVVDEEEAAQSPFGRWVAGGGSDKPLGWAVRTSELDDVARRLELSVGANSRAAPGGRRLRWRVAGIEEAAAGPSLPFFLEWGEGTPFPGRADAVHPAGSVQIARLELDGDAERISAWLGAHRLPISVRPGSPAVAGVVLTGPAGEFVL
jgi:glyoxalase-like protein